MPLHGQLFSAEAIPKTMRRCASTGYNQTEELCRLNIAAAFMAADRNHNHTITRMELEVVLREELAISLQDPRDDLDTIFDTMDKKHTGKVTEAHFLGFFEKAIEHRVAIGGDHIDTPDLMKDSFQQCVTHARKERWGVICAFKESFDEFDQNGKGFGVHFWGSKWRFILFDRYYGDARNEDGSHVYVADRFNHLLARLALAAKDEEPWLLEKLNSDPIFKHDLIRPEFASEYAAEWLKSLQAAGPMPEI
ncbi:hypothetical protein T484DRAFT_2923976 [Baffinella frigidus]|nr:hypothetical protein T484DRAFT_2923976 [Cryptophyta sp. CCMP2293]